MLIRKQKRVHQSLKKKLFITASDCTQPLEQQMESLTEILLTILHLAQLPEVLVPMVLPLVIKTQRRPDLDQLTIVGRISARIFGQEILFTLVQMKERMVEQEKVLRKLQMMRKLMRKRGKIRQWTCPSQTGRKNLTPLQRDVILLVQE